MSLQSKDELISKLRSKKFRDIFVSSRISNTLAFQIRAMRQNREWSQTKLASELGTSQNAICRLESPHYGRPSITTLKKLASLFDVGLAVWFVPFSDLVDRFTGLSTASVLVPSFDEDITSANMVTMAEAIPNLRKSKNRHEPRKLSIDTPVIP